MNKKYHSENVAKPEVKDPVIAGIRKAGHFVIIRTGKQGVAVFIHY